MAIYESSNTITECVAIKDHTSSTSACFKCNLMSNFDGTCVAIAHTKMSILVLNSSQGLSDITVVRLNKSSGSFCGGCVDGITFDDHTVVVFAYSDGVLIPGSGMLVAQHTPSGTLLIIIFSTNLRSSCVMWPPQNNIIRHDLVISVPFGIDAPWILFCCV